MVGPVVAQRYMALIHDAREEAAGRVAFTPLQTKSSTPPQPHLGVIERMSDDCGMLQHARSTIPDRRHGYCLDDNARALMLAAECEAERTEERRGGKEGVSTGRSRGEAR